MELSKDFYSSIGLTFRREKHGAGPAHFSTQIGNTIFELYPASERFPATPSRLGFTVASVESVLNQWRAASYQVLSEPQESPYGIRAVVADPDGHRVELTQAPHG